MSREVLSKSSVRDGRRDIASAHEPQLPILNASEIQLIEDVPRVGNARISLCRWDKPGFPPIHVAKKSLFTGSLSERYRTQLQSEMNILARLQHENIVKTFGIVEIDNDIGIVMEYLRCGSYLNFFETIWDIVDCTPNWKKFMVPLKIRILDEIVDAMTYLHGFKPDNRVLHLDLKSDNVLLQGTLNAKICDFGLSIMSTLTKLRTSRTVESGSASGTLGYIAPERLHNIKTKPTSKSDVYSFGILEWEILADIIPYEDLRPYEYCELKDHIVNEDLRPDEKFVPDVYKTEHPKLVDMMKRSWSKDPDDRPSFQGLHGELNTVKTSIKNFQAQAEASATKILHLWETCNTDPKGVGPTHTQPTVLDAPPSKLDDRYEPTCDDDLRTDEPLISTDPSKRSAHSTEETVPMRHTSSVPVSTTEPKRVGPTHIPPTVLHVPPSRLDDHDEPPFDDVPSAEEPLIANNRDRPRERDDVEKRLCSSRKILFIVALIISLCVAGAVIIWKTTSGSANAYQDCPYLKPPLHGHVNCTKVTGNVNVKCTFTCDKGYLSMGPNEVTCTGGKWSERPPVCGPACPGFKPLEFRHFNCSNAYFVNSTCTCSCRYPHQIKGNSSLTCQLNKQLSHPEPTCMCPSCFIGDNCQYSISWKSVENALKQTQPLAGIKVSYGEETFKCTISLTTHVKLTWTGRCTDMKTGNFAKCHGYASTIGAAEHAAAQLIRSQVQYPEPCDPQDMDKVKGCM